jgi:AcrR family transcriptional regulator
MARPRTKEDERRDEIVGAALQLIVREGYNNVTLADIAEQVGVSKGLISYYFPRKEDVFLAVLNRIVERIAARFERFCSAEAPAPARMTMFFSNLFGNEKRARRYYTVVIDYMAQAIRNRAVQEYTQAIYDAYRVYMERVIIDGVASGEFRQVDPHRTASMFMALMEGLILQWFFDQKGFKLDEAYQTCVDFMNHYLLPEGGNTSAALSSAV